MHASFFCFTYVLISKGSLPNQSHFPDTIEHLLTDTQFSEPSKVRVLTRRPRTLFFELTLSLKMIFEKLFWLWLSQYFWRLTRPLNNQENKLKRIQLSKHWNTRAVVRNLLMLWPSNTVPQVVLTPTLTLFLLLLHSCHFTTLRSHNVNTCFLMVLDDFCERVICCSLPQKGHDPEVENHCTRRKQPGKL